MLSLEGGAAALMHSLGAPTADAELPPGSLHDPSVTLLPALAQCNPCKTSPRFLLSVAAQPAYLSSAVIVGTGA